MVTVKQIRHRMRRWIHQVALFLCAILVALFCLEIGFRLARRGEIGFDRLGWQTETQNNQSGRIYQKTSEFEFSTNVNQLGFRGPEVSIEKPHGTKRVLILGDSFAFGWGVNDDQLFTSHLAKELEGSSQRYEIINTSGGSLSPLIYYVRLKNTHMRLKPDLVLLFINYADFREDYFFKRNIMRDARGEIMDINPLYIDGQLDTWRWLRNHSEFFSFTYNRINRPLRRIQILGVWRYLQAKLKGERTRDAMFEMDRVASKDMDVIEYDAYFMLRENVNPDAVRKHIAETTGYLAQIGELVKQTGGSVVLVLLPNGVQIGPNQWSKGRHMWGFETGRVYESPLVLKELATFARKQGIGFVNLVSSFKQNNNRALFFERDGHLRPEGHLVLADALLASLEFRSALALP